MTDMKEAIYKMVATRASDLMEEPILVLGHHTDGNGNVVFELADECQNYRYETDLESLYQGYELSFVGKGSNDYLEMAGFYLYANGKDYFFSTGLKRKSVKLAREICKYLAGESRDVEDKDVKAVYRLIRPAICKMKYINNVAWHFINGNGFGVSGDDIVAVPVWTGEERREIKR